MATVLELRSIVREQIKKMNKDYEQYLKDVKEGKTKKSSLIEKEVRHIQESYQMGRKGRGNNPLSQIGVRSARKNELEKRLKQLEPLSRLLKEDTRAGAEARQQRFDKAYESYLKNHDYITKDEYSDLIYTLEGMKDMIQDFGYEDYSNIYAEATPEGKSKFSRYLQEAVKETKGAGATTEEFMDTLRTLMYEDGAIR